MTLTDAEATIRGQILLGITDNAHETRIKADPSVDNIFKRITDPFILWALKDLIKELEE